MLRDEIHIHACKDMRYHMRLNFIDAKGEVHTSTAIFPPRAKFKRLNPQVFGKEKLVFYLLADSES